MTDWLDVAVESPEMPGPGYDFQTRRREGRHDGSRQVTPPTRRNLQVLAASMRWDRKGAAAVLGLHPNTVRNHIWVALTKLDVRSRWEAAFKLGWLVLPADIDIGAGQVPGSRSDKQERLPGPDDHAESECWRDCYTDDLAARRSLAE